MRRTAFILLFGLLTAAPVFGEQSPASKIPELAACRQLILVTSEEWSSVRAELRCFERPTAGAPWEESLPATPAVLGRKGSAWGIGLHGSPAAGTTAKKEGDERTPAGVFALHEIFGYASRADARITRFPYRAITAQTVGVDDPSSHFYNRLVEARSPSLKDWNSAEVMLLPSGLYRWGVFVEHNWKQVPAAGSCIFLHIWEGPSRGTSGCTAMPAPAMEGIARWLNQDRRPVLVQLPRAEYHRLKQAWALP